ncbi:Minichromosome maintenance protein 10 [Nakaseomyces bracarensis]|uniref:Minichromosome maintenance protein 10 n=1 Tax=Nakaseomyces bracarensis TaxID=273131 RepID=A0ABR4NN44_9SACH
MLGIDGDPREVKKADPFDHISSDEGEVPDIQKELEMIERKRQDLMDRLKEKRRREQNKFVDPNLKGINTRGDIEVPQSPKKQTAKPMVEIEMPLKALNSQHKQQKEVNPNELKVQQDGTTSGTTSYFLNKFQNSKIHENKKITNYQDMMSTRIHTFGGADLSSSKPIAVDELEEYSNVWIKKRYLQKEELNEILRGIKILRLNKLFAKVKPPKFSEPQYSNWAVVGIISAKEDVKLTNAAKPVKYFKFTLTNFQHNLDIYLFGKKPVERYYNLRVGDVIAILNPEILPWRPSGCVNGIKSFNLRIGHEFHCILEIASSRDIGWCPVVNHGQNKKCGAPINIKTDRCCEFHREIQMRSTASKRIELSGSYALGAPTKVGVQPSLYKNNEHSNNTRRTSSNNRFVINNQGKAEKEVRKSDQEAHHFRSKKAAKAFFDENFQDPDMLNNLDSKRRKINDNKLDKRLIKALDSRDQSQLKDKKEVKDVTEKTLQTGIIQRLGFDPTRGQIAKVLDITRNTETNERAKQKAGLISNLIKYKKDKITLVPSREVRLERKERRENIWKKHFGKNDNSDDSDLEIV